MHIHVSLINAQLAHVVTEHAHVHYTSGLGTCIYIHVHVHVHVSHSTTVLCTCTMYNGLQSSISVIFQFSLNIRVENM